ncbi:iron complex transport system substrate-binding protein [Sphaerotilus hippei]|uniref:Iron complex transport system substrate-binding protein n=1 Tax=Sphaerotilus hippei TaxID=744406 RepID=A0A318GV37_9BURK|nr:cobalamin-binding protein [Sphaerotilus hippei]PXW93268.1 iron complex transport system substrate-binding protein [Sphaerotilus hippei]
MSPVPDRFPQRIVCLTEETTETLYLLGQQHRIVGISGYTVRPPQARQEKPRVSAFLSAKIDRILELEPDLVLGFSDLQADIASQLIRAGVAVHVFNQRRIAGILQTIAMIGAMVGAHERSAVLLAQLQAGLDEAAAAARGLPRRPRVYFEEWMDPLITGIGWVSELIELAGGQECFPELAGQSLGRHRIIADPLEVVRRSPELILGSWCGRKFRPEQVMAREGWADVPAVRHAQVFEIKSSEILQPGPAALTDGLRQIRTRLDDWARLHA